MHISEKVASKAVDIISFYRENPVLAAEDLLNVDLDIPQKYVLNKMWFYSYTIITAGRGCGKSFLLSVVSALRALLFSSERILILSPSFRQCVTGDVFVLTSGGYRRADSFDGGPTKLYSGFGMRDSLAYYKNAVEPVLHITTEFGFTLGGAFDHRIMVPIEGKKCEYTTLGSLSVGDRVLLHGGAQVFGSRHIEDSGVQIDWIGVDKQHIPECVFQFDKKSMTTYLRRFFDEFGWVWKHKDGTYSISFTYPYVKVLQEIQMLLFNMGILFVSQDNSWLEGESCTYTTAGFFDTGLFIEEIGISSSFDEGYVDTAYSAVAKACFPDEKADGTLFSAHKTERYVIDTISTIEEGLSHTYDFTVDVDSSYVSNCFISHNSKMVFDELKRRYSESPILREASVKKPVVGADRCYLNLRGAGEFTGSSIEAYPLGSGDKIRGLRGHYILVDEYAQVPNDIFEGVIRPMGATATTPMENVRRLQALEKKVNLGVLSREDYESEVEGMQKNKIVGVTSAYYQFNHVYNRIQAYQTQIDNGSSRYALAFISYEDMSRGFLEQANVEEAKTTMGRTLFNMEYRAIWESDSDGIFKASLIDANKVPTCQVKPVGTIGDKYVFGIDPARSSDSFAIVGFEIGNPSQFVYAFSAVGLKFPKMASIIQDLTDEFSTLSLFMDAGPGGGGMAIKDILANEHFSAGRLILDVDDPEHVGLVGKRILHMHTPNSASVADLNYNALNLLEQSKIQFPYPPADFSEEKEAIQEEVELTIKQMTSVIMTETRSGNVKFDIPASGKGNRKKDLYSAFLLASKALQSVLSHKTEDASYVNRGGLVIPVSRVIQGPSIYSI